METDQGTEKQWYLRTSECLGHPYKGAYSLKRYRHAAVQRNDRPTQSKFGNAFGQRSHRCSLCSSTALLTKVQTKHKQSWHSIRYTSMRMFNIHHAVLELGILQRTHTLWLKCMVLHFYSSHMQTFHARNSIRRVFDQHIVQIIFWKSSCSRMLVR